MQKNINNFFNKNASFYKNKYFSKNKFHNYFFNSRSKIVLEFFYKNKLNNFENVLDIGSGNGFYYDLMTKEKNINFKTYTGTDPSKEMLKISNIPLQFKYNKKVWEIDFKGNKFQLIFLIGVSTYINEKELFDNLNFIVKYMKTNSYFIVTLNNKYSLDLIMRRFFKFLLSPFIGQETKDKYVLFSVDKINIHNHKKIINYLNKYNINLIQKKPHNFSYFPLNYIFPNLIYPIHKIMKKLGFLFFLTSSATVYFFKKY